MNDQDTTDYLKDLDNMTKVVLKAENEEQIVNAAKTLEDNSVKHYIWREQPENIISALATAPRSREILKPLLSEFKLFRWFREIVNQSYRFLVLNTLLLKVEVPQLIYWWCYPITKLLYNA